MYKSPTKEKLKQSLINSYIDHIKYCTKCDSAIWINDTTVDKINSGTIKELFCSDCLMKKKIKNSFKALTKKDYLKENKDNIKQIVQSKLSLLELNDQSLNRNRSEGNRNSTHYSSGAISVNMESAKEVNEMSKSTQLLKSLKLNKSLNSYASLKSPKASEISPNKVGSSDNRFTTPQTITGYSEASSVEKEAMMKYNENYFFDQYSKKVNLDILSNQNSNTSNSILKNQTLLNMDPDLAAINEAEQNKNFIKDKLYQDYLNRKQRKEEIKTAMEQQEKLEKKKKNKELLKKVKEGLKLPAYLSRTQTRTTNFETEDEVLNHPQDTPHERDNVIQRKYQKESTSLYTKNQNISSGNPNHIRNNRFKSSEVAITKNNESDHFKFINKESIKKEISIKKSKEYMSDESGEQSTIQMKKSKLESNHSSDKSVKLFSQGESTIINGDGGNSFFSQDELIFNKSPKKFNRPKNQHSSSNNSSLDKSIKMKDRHRDSSSNSLSDNMNTNIKSYIINNKTKSKKIVNPKITKDKISSNNNEKLKDKNVKNKSSISPVKGRGSASPVKKTNEVKSKSSSPDKKIQIRKNSRSLNGSADKINTSLQSKKLYRVSNKNNKDISITSVKRLSNASDKMYKVEKELSPKNSKLATSDDFIENALENNNQKMKDVEMMQITDYNRLFELNKKLFQQLKGEDPEETDLLDETDIKYELKGNLKFITENSVNFHSQSNFFKEHSTLKEAPKYDSWEKKPAKCKMCYMDGSEYEGFMLNGKFHGYGIYKFKNGHVYTGEFIKGYQHGKGKLIYRDGSKYYGDFQGGYRWGTGTMVWKDSKHRYEGNFQKDKKHGYGKERFTNGDLYFGQYNNGKKEGKGQYIWSSQTMYKGDYKSNRMEGWGVLVWPATRRRYEGQMKGNMRHGIGTFSWPDGSVYQGGFMHDKRYGYGLVKYPNGRVIEGEWVDDMRHGKTTENNGEHETWYYRGKEVSHEYFQHKLNESKEDLDKMENARTTATNIKKVLEKNNKSERLQDSILTISRISE